MKKLKLFVWTGFCPDYKGGLAFSIAENEVEAKELVEKSYGLPVYTWGELEIRRLDHRVARCVSGGG